MIAPMEKVSLDMVQPFLQRGQGTVGISISVSHDAPTPIGRSAIAEAELIEVDRKKPVFRATVREGNEVIGKEMHTRFVVDSERFFQKAPAYNKRTHPPGTGDAFLVNGSRFAAITGLLGKAGDSDRSPFYRSEALNAIVQPLKDVLLYFFAVFFVQHFVTAAGINADCHIM